MLISSEQILQIDLSYKSREAIQPKSAPIKYVLNQLSISIGFAVEQRNKGSKIACETRAQAVQNVRPLSPKHVRTSPS
jgi:hypothetical protein